MVHIINVPNYHYYYPRVRTAPGRWAERWDQQMTLQPRLSPSSQYKQYKHPALLLSNIFCFHNSKCLSSSSPNTGLYTTDSQAHTTHDTDMDRELNRQRIICMYFIVSFLTSNNQQDSILTVYTFGPLLRYLTSNVSGSKASFSYIESCLASTSLICLSFIHQPWFTEILQLMDSVEMIPTNYNCSSSPHLFSKSVSLASCCTGRKEKVAWLDPSTVADSAVSACTVPCKYFLFIQKLDISI